MHLVIVTAEPFGAYHLIPLVEPVTRREALLALRVTHLLPYPSPPQGRAFATSCELDVVADADVVLITGGTLTAWTAAVAWRAAAAGVPVVIAEVASAAATPYPGVVPPILLGLPATARSSADLRAHLGHDIPLSEPIGTLTCDEVPVWEPRPRSLLALTRVSSEHPDGGRRLREALSSASEHGWEITVRPHPREPCAPWESWPLRAEGDLLDHARTAARVLMYPGTSIMPLCALGVPVLTLAFTDAGGLDAEDERVSALSSVVGDLRELPRLLEDPLVPAHPLVEELCGPLGGAGERILDALLEVARTHPRH